MFSTEFLLKLLNRDKISQYIYIILFVSLTTVFDFFTLFVFGGMIGIHLYLAGIATVSLIGVFILIKLLRNTVTALEKKHSIGVFPETEFYQITTLFLSSGLIIFPGIVSSTLGFVLIIPYFRNLIGRLISKKLKLDWYAVYEYKEIYNN